MTLFFNIMNFWGIFLWVLNSSAALKYANPPIPRVNPGIRVTHWQETGEMEWTSPADDTSFDPDLIAFNASTKTLSISNNIAGVILSCSAHYPIEWVSDVGEQLITSRKSFFLRGSSSREAEDISRPGSYTYTVRLNFRGNFKEFTGNYTCRKINGEFLSESVYIFWEGVTAEYLVQSGKSVDVLLEPGEKALIIPCRVSLEDVKVTLLKSVPDMYFVEDFHRVEENETVLSFDPRKGFKLNTSLLTNPYGLYKCVTEQENDFLQVRVNRSIDGPRSAHHVDVMKMRASISFDSKRVLLTCCSNSESAPTIYAAYCASPVCKFYERILANGIASLFQGQKLSGFRMGAMRNKSCSAMPLHEGMMGYFQCVGDGIDVVRTLFTSIPIGVNETVQGYWSWEDIQASKLVTISVNENLVEIKDGFAGRPRGSHARKGGSRRNGRRFMYRPHRNSGLLKAGHLPNKVYVGESFNFTCKACSSYFAHGSQLTVLYSDGRVHRLPLIEELSTQSQEISNYPVYSFKRITTATATLTLEQNMTTVVCHAPVHNSSTWITQELKLSLIDPILPSFPSGQQDEILYWTLNETDKLIDCQASGEPAPSYNLTLNGKEVKSGKDEMLMERQSGSLRLKVKQVSHESHGDYLCTAYNVAGVVQKKFTIIVLEPTHWTLIISLSVTLSLLFIALIVVALKFQLQKKLRDRLLGQF